MYPVSTLVQEAYERPFVIRYRNMRGRTLKRLEFPHSLTLLMEKDNNMIITTQGTADVQIHRRFWQEFGKYLHWVKITIREGGPVIQAQLCSTEEQACNNTQTIGYAFIQDKRPYEEKYHETYNHGQVQSESFFQAQPSWKNDPVPQQQLAGISEGNPTKPLEKGGYANKNQGKGDITDHRRVYRDKMQAQEGDKIILQDTNMITHRAEGKYLDQNIHERASYLHITERHYALDTSTSNAVVQQTPEKLPLTRITPLGAEEKNQLLCQICSDKVSGFHYGAYSCEGCKLFFGRIIKQEKQIKPCRDNQQCNITKKTRKRCQDCRIKKCIKVGMDQQAVRMGRPFNQRKNTATAKQYDKSKIQQTCNDPISDTAHINTFELQHDTYKPHKKFRYNSRNKSNKPTPKHGTIVHHKSDCAQLRARKTLNMPEQEETPNLYLQRSPIIMTKPARPNPSVTIQKALTSVIKYAPHHSQLTFTTSYENNTMS